MKHVPTRFLFYLELNDPLDKRLQKKPSKNARYVLRLVKWEDLSPTESCKN